MYIVDFFIAKESYIQQVPTMCVTCEVKTCIEGNWAQSESCERCALMCTKHNLLRTHPHNISSLAACTWRS
jgi:hypothetical protein